MARHLLDLLPRLKQLRFVRPAQTFLKPPKIIRNRYRHAASLFLLRALPKSYRDEAISLFHEGPEEQGLLVAFNYFVGGINYRARKYYFWARSFNLKQRKSVLIRRTVTGRS